MDATHDAVSIDESEDEFKLFPESDDDSKLFPGLGISILPGIVGSPTVNPARPARNPYPEEIVPLHRMCERCQRFFDNYEMLTWLEDPSLDDHPDTDWPRNYSGGVSGLCTVSELLESRQSCHFCEMVAVHMGSWIDESPHESIQLTGRSSRGSWTYQSPPELIELSVRSSPVQMGALAIVIFPLGSTRDEGVDNVKKLHVIALDYRSQDNVFDHPFMAHHVPREPANNLAKLREWLQKCRSEHYRCNNWCSNLGARRLRPTRALELTHGGIRLRCDLETIEEFEYLALSHIWGTDPSQQLQLTVSTLHEYQRAMPLNELSPMFIEAIRITRSLGFFYLWIDSLCIIQDCDSDWKTEASMMSTVYSNAVCTIVLSSPPQLGPIPSRDDPRGLTPCIVRRATKARKGLYVVPFEDTGTSRLIQRNWPISSRAWTFQEQILSPRTIIFGYETIMWECVERFCDELAGSWLTGLGSTRHDHDVTQKALLCARRRYEGPEKPRDKDERYSMTIADETKYLETFPNWDDIISEYRMRHLTRSSDRIMAFAGVAQAYSAEHGLTYLAGMWKEHLPCSLRWHFTLESRDFWLGLPQESPPQSVPSWSWFAAPIYFTDPAQLSHGQFEYTVLSHLFLASLVSFGWPNAPINSTPPTAYFDFVGLQITLELPVCTTTIAPKDSLIEYKKRELQCVGLEEQLALLPNCSSTCTYLCDDLREFDEPPATIRIALISDDLVTMSPGYTLGHHFLQGLALAPGANKSTWKRVGYWSANVLYDHPSTSKHVYRQDTGKEGLMSRAEGKSSDSSEFIWGKESIFLRLPGVQMETITLV